MNPEINPVIGRLFAVAIAFLAILFLVALIMKINAFLYALECINQEISRTTGEEQSYWKQEKRRLWLSLLPFYRRRGQ